MATKTMKRKTSRVSESRDEQGASSFLPVLGAEGDECDDCGAPLAVDQRYCLDCGGRRTGPRVEYGQVLTGSGPDSHVAPTAAEEGRGRTADWGGAKGVAGGIAVLGIMLLLGVLIGRGQEAPIAQQPVVVNGSTATDAVSEATNKDGKDASGGKAVDVGNAKTLDEGTLDALKGASGKSYFEISKNLPDTIATPGKAEKNDPNRKPGGGSGAVTIP